ncbi:hypothetical protein C1H46_007566 [Malus baccata]|uniref:Uncharacterized protein n=1 Tax=Malus baccata TaxID=106549 RepID=A0A540N6V1_MALBA|nr:hypothetical protein C1H46_007566 [Malus baccata]
MNDNQPEEMVKCSPAVPEPPSVTVGLDLPLKELKMKLLKDEKVSMLVLTAAGGCGKTTLAKMFCQDQDVKDTFKNNIFFLHVSKKPNLDLIVHQLHRRKGSELPAFENEDMAANWLQQFLKESRQNPLLLVLDDVWSGSESLLEKFDQFKHEGETDGYYTEHFVTEHDMLRELAINQASQDPIEHRKRLFLNICGNKLPKWLTEQKYQAIKAGLLSISTDGAFSAKWPNMQVPEAEVLVLNFETKNYALPGFVEKMDKLKVLILNNYGLLPAELDNFELLGSLSNLKRIRLERISIPPISRVLKQLKSLQKISLFMCDIGQGFVKILDALPNLVELNIDYCHDLVQLPANLCDLVHLKKLSITNCHKLSALPADIGKLVNLEVLRLRSCADLLELPGSIRNLKDLKFLDISDCFSVKELPEGIGAMCSMEKINVSQCSKLKELPASVMDLEQLNEVICDKETKTLWEPFLPILTNMRIKVIKEDINLNWLNKLPP